MYGANTNIEYDDYPEMPTAFFFAYRDILKMFLDHAIDLDLSIRNFEGNTALEFALKYKELETIKMMAHKEFVWKHSS